MASTFVEASPGLNQLFRDISLMLSPAESEDVVESAKRIFGKQFYSLGDQDLLSCLGRLHKFDYLSRTKLTLLKEFVAPKSDKEKEISDTIEKFKVSFPSQAKLEKEFQGRSDEIKKITERLQMGQPAVVNLHGSAGVGKTTVAKEICAKWGKSYVFDLREAKDVMAIGVNIMGTLGLTVPVGNLGMDKIVGRIHVLMENNSEIQPVLFLLDNVEQFTKGQGKEGSNLRTQFLQFLRKLSFVDREKTRTLKILLTSRTQLNDPEKVIDFELQPLVDSLSEKILLPVEVSSINAWEKEKLLGICKGVPLLLKGTAAILKHKRKSPNDLIAVIEKPMISQGAARTPSESKLEKDAKEKPFDLQEEGVSKPQTSIIKEMFDTLPSDSLRVLAVSVSLFCGPFSASTAATVFYIPPSEAVAQLEGLVTNAIIHVVDEEAKELMYDIHPLLRKYADSIKSDEKFHKCYTKAKRRFHEHFFSKMKTIAGLIESDYVKAFDLFAKDRPNYEFAVDISLLPEYFSIPGEYHANALIASLFNAMLSGEKQTELFHSWAEMCEDDGKSGRLLC